MKENCDYIVFKNSKSCEKCNYSLPADCVLKKFKPTLKTFLAKKTSLNDFIWKIITFNRYSIYSVFNSGGEVVHQSKKIGKCFKFPFLNSKSYEIGPCFTLEKYRGKNIYPYVIKSIIKDDEHSDFFMLVNKENTSSINGIVKAGLKQAGYAKRTQGGIWHIEN